MVVPTKSTGMTTAEIPGSSATLAIRSSQPIIMGNRKYMTTPKNEEMLAHSKPGASGDFRAQMKTLAEQSPARSARQLPNQPLPATASPDASPLPKRKWGFAMSRPPAIESISAKVWMSRSLSPRQACPIKAATTTLMLVRAATSPGAAPSCTATVETMTVALPQKHLARIHFQSRRRGNCSPLSREATTRHTPTTSWLHESTR
mmetsp:Transcript_46867/g.135062  ORF Transcript_46867/g.135062 Transcript_46867/m.135062 type:complete len:204 (+) Transcript_46867:894-1505(+)